MKVVGRRRLGEPSVAKGAAQGIRIEVSDGRLHLDSSVKKSGEQTVGNRRSSLGPWRGPRRSTSTARGHTRGVVWAVSRIGRWWYRFKMRWPPLVCIPFSQAVQHMLTVGSFNPQLFLKISLVQCLCQESRIEHT